MPQMKSFNWFNFFIVTHLLNMLFFINSSFIFNSLVKIDSMIVSNKNLKWSW